jgi:hypothetical protein
MTTFSLLLSHALTMASFSSFTFHQSPWQHPPSPQTQAAPSHLSIPPSWFHLHSSATNPPAHTPWADKTALSPLCTCLLIPIQLACHLYNYPLTSFFSSSSSSFFLSSFSLYS